MAEERLYQAARQGKYHIAQQIIMKEGVNINAQIKGHKNSTALHAAAYSGYGPIVQLLVGMGCDRRIKNDYGLTAAQEAKTEKIKQLILYPRRGNTERFGVTKQDLPPFNDDIDCLVGAHWLGFSDNKRECVVKELYSIYPAFGKEAQQLIKAKDIYWYNAIIRMYTKESPLYKRMNNDIASWNKLTKLKHYALELNKALNYIRLAKEWKKRCYRSVTLTDEKIKSFKKKKTKFSGDCQEIAFIFQLPSFSSCSKSKQLCLKWGGNVLLVLEPYKDWCTYPVDISHLSVFPNEQEVLLTYKNQFQCIGIKKVNYPNSNTKWEVIIQCCSY